MFASDVQISMFFTLTASSYFDQLQAFIYWLISRTVDTS